jgi:hypothetical protein
MAPNHRRGFAVQRGSEEAPGCNKLGEISLIDSQRVLAELARGEPNDER